MNKKLVALLIPVMLLPMIGFAYAHWTDTVYKQYKMHAGTVDVEIDYYHVLNTTSYDVNCNGDVFGDELNITEVWETDFPWVKKDSPSPQLVGLRIKADPIYPCWELRIEIYIHNVGRLSVKMDDPIVEWYTNGTSWYNEDPCWDNTTVGDDPDFDNFHTGPPAGYKWPCTKPNWKPAYFQYDMKFYRNVTGVGWVQFEPTTDGTIKPCKCIKVVEYIHFLGQPYPEFECHWCRLDVWIPFHQHVGENIWCYEGGPERACP